MAGPLTEDSIDFWKKKCNDQEEIIKTLSGHCVQVVKKHEELLVKFQVTQDQYLVMVEKLKDQKEQVNKARDVLAPVMREYQELKEKYDIAIRCQREAESFASRVNSSNVKMKRQSHMIMSQLASGQNLVSINIDDYSDEVEEEPKKYLETLDKKIEELSAEKATLSASVKVLTQDLEIQKEKNAGLKKRVDEYREELRRSNDRVSRQGKELHLLAQTSAEAIREYKTLQDQYEYEVVSSKAAHTRANQLRAESVAAKRQSAALLSNISGDQKLMKALIDIEELTTKYETDKQAYENKIEALQQELQEERDKLGVQALEDETENLTKERDSLLERLAEAEKLVNEAQTQHSQLQGKYAELEEKYEKSKNEPRIPVPPPPPPPPPAPPVRQGLLSLIAGGKKKKKEMKNQRLAKGGASTNQDFDKALKEMMARIESGKALKPVLKTRTGGVELFEPDESKKQSLPEEKSAVSELEGILTKMKKAKSEEDLCAIDDPFSEKDSELGQIFKKIQQKNQGTNLSMDRPAPKAMPRKLSVITDEDEDKA